MGRDGRPHVVPVSFRYNPDTDTIDVGGRLERLYLGPLTPAETAKLLWRLPGLESVTQEQRSRAYRDVGGHPRTLEYLDALLRRGQARFDDLAERMESRLAEEGVEDPQAWIASPGRGFDVDLAAAVTMAADDVVLADLLQDLARVPLARELVVGASVYRVPVDDTALIWQVTEEIERPPKPRAHRPHPTSRTDPARNHRARGAVG